MTTEFSLVNAIFTACVAGLVASYVICMIRHDMERRFAAFRDALHLPPLGLAFLEEQRHEVDKLRVEITARMEQLEEQYERMARRLDAPPGADE